MITPLEIQKKTLIHQLEQEYGINTSELIFIPQGEVSWGYKVICLDNSTYFLKIHKSSNLKPDRFQLLYDLHTKAKIDNIVYPKLTSEGKVEILIEGYPSVLFNFIEGRTSKEKPFSDDQYEHLGEVLAKVHQAYKIVGEYRIKEDFNVHNQEEFSRVTDAIDNHNPKDVIEKEALDLFKQNEAKLEQELRELERMGKLLQVNKPEFVLCHGEPSPDNIMVDMSGKVYLIDWDDPIMAPKEKDLLFFDKTMGSLVKGYSKYSTDTAINEDARSFYSHSWNVAEIIDWGERLLISDLYKEEKQHALDQFRDFLDYSGLGDD